MKKLLKLVVALILLLVIALVVVVVFIDRLAVQAVERGGTYALGVPTTLDSASVGLLAGDVGLAGLKVANPEGFESPAFLTLGEGNLHVDMDALLDPEVVRAEQLSFEDVTLYVERREGRTNYGVLLEHLERLSDPSAPEDSQPGKRFAIGELVVRNIQAHFDLLPQGGTLTQVSVTVPEIRLQDVGSGGGATVAEITAVLVEALLKASIEAGGSKIPVELLGDLRDQLGQLEDSLQEMMEGELKGLQRDLGGALERLKR